MNCGPLGVGSIVGSIRIESRAIEFMSEPREERSRAGRFWHAYLVDP